MSIEKEAPESSENQTEINKAAPRSVEYKTFRFEVSKKSESYEDGQKFGTVAGYISTYGDLDRGGDVIQKGAFTKSLERYKNENRKIRVFYQHDTNALPIGGISPSSIIDDEKGLYCEAKLNLSVQRGKDCYELAKQGVLTDFSFGYSVSDYEMIDNRKRLLKELELWEASLVTEPMNPNAKVTAVKNNTSKKYTSENVKELSSDLKITLTELGLMSQKFKDSLLKRAIEEVLCTSGQFTKSAAAYVAGQHATWSDSKNNEQSDSVNNCLVDNELKTLKESLNSLNQLLRG